MVQVTTNKALVLQRIPAREKMIWPTWWLDVERKIIISPSGEQQILQSNVLSDVLEIAAQSNHQCVMVLGGDNAASGMREVWIKQPSSYGWHIVDQHRDRKIVIYEKEGKEVTLYSVSLWMANVKDVETARNGFYAAEHILQQKFGENTYLLMTPTKVGRDIFHTHISYGHLYYVLGENDIQTLRTFVHQGRVETIHAIDDDITHIYELDAIFMYAACMSNLPIGECIHDEPKDSTPDMKVRYKPAFYRATFTVPQGWHHIGLVNAANTGQENARATNQHYPNTPGDVITAWVSNEELYLAHAHGWNPIIHERMIWLETESKRTSDPFEIWIKGLRDIRTQAKLEAYGVYSPQIADIARGIALSTLGGFNSHEIIQRGFTPASEIDKMPANTLTAVPYNRGIDWTVKRPSKVTRWTHPEWAMSAWGRARSRIAGMALKLPYESIIAIRVDAIWTTANPEALYDNKGIAVSADKVQSKMLTAGYWRVKTDRNIHAKRPTTNAEFSQFQKQARQQEMIQYDEDIYQLEEVE